MYTNNKLTPIYFYIYTTFVLLPSLHIVCEHRTSHWEESHQKDLVIDHFISRGINSPLSLSLSARAGARLSRASSIIRNPERCILVESNSFQRFAPRVRFSLFILIMPLPRIPGALSSFKNHFKLYRFRRFFFNSRNL